MKHEFYNDHARNCYNIAGQAAVAVALGSQIQHAWVDDDGGGVSVFLTGRPGRDYWHQAIISTGGAAACCLYRSEKIDARECMRLIFRVIPGERGSAYDRHQRAIDAVRRRLGKRSRAWLTQTALSDLAIDRALKIIEENWPGVQALAQHFADWPTGTRGVALASIFRRGMEKSRC